MKRVRIKHETTYHYHQPVTFGPHQAMMRPREGHDVKIVGSIVQIEPAASVRWLRDVNGNSVAIIVFKESGTRLRIYSEVDVDIYEEPPIEWLIDPSAESFPFQYAADEQIEIVPYRLPSYAHDGTALQQWLAELYRPGHIIDTSELLNRLNTRIHDSFRYQYREEYGVQRPCETLVLGSGSCRDYAVFMMEAARHWGFASRFVTGYIQMADGQHGSTHAWTEIYIPGAGWRGFDPTNNKRAEAEHISVAVAREQEKAAPLSGTWSGPGNAFSHMEVKVEVVQV